MGVGKSGEMRCGDQPAREILSAAISLFLSLSRERTLNLRRLETGRESNGAMGAVAQLPAQDGEGGAGIRIQGYRDGKDRDCGSPPNCACLCSCCLVTTVFEKGPLRTF